MTWRAAVIGVTRLTQHNKHRCVKLTEKESLLSPEEDQHQTKVNVLFDFLELDFTKIRRNYSSIRFPICG